MTQNHQKNLKYTNEMPLCMVTLLSLSKPPRFCCMFLCVCPYKSQNLVALSNINDILNVGP